MKFLELIDLFVRSLEAGKSTVPEAVAKKQSTEHIVPDEFIDKDEGKKRVNE